MLKKSLSNEGPSLKRPEKFSVPFVLSFAALITIFLVGIYIPAISKPSIARAQGLGSLPATSCRAQDDGWFTADRAAGRQDTDTKFNATNSAIWRGSGGLLECDSFAQNTDPKQALGLTLHLSNKESATDNDLTYDVPDLAPTNISDRGTEVLANTDATDPLSSDFVHIQMSTDNGATWTEIYRLSPANIPPNNLLTVLLPTDKAIDLKSLRVGVKANQSNSDQILLIDNMALTYETGQAPQLEVNGLTDTGKIIKQKQLSYGSSQTIKFELKAKPNSASVVDKFSNAIQDLVSDDQAPPISIETNVVGPERPVNAKVETTWKEKDASGNDVWDVTLSPPTDFKSGKHTASFTLTDNNGNQQTITKNFLWGVLAINTNKSIYRPDDTVDLSMAVLDDKGEMVCDAELSLEIRGPNKTEVLSTKKGSIWANPECKTKEVVEKPDYQSIWALTGESSKQLGTYQTTLTAITANGTYQITDKFEVRENQPFEVSRLGPTRIYPLQNYPMTINIKANQNFTGEISEVVPEGFKIIGSTVVDKTLSKALSNNLEITAINDSADKQLSWNMTLIAGHEYEIRYEFDAPDLSPEFWLLGPMRIGSIANEDFMEIRQWQIASDALPSNGVKKSSLVKPTATGTQVISGLGFRPKAVIFYWTQQTGEGNEGGSTGSNSGMGFATGASSERALSIWDDNQTNAGASDSGRATYDNASIVFQDREDGSLDFGVADVTSFDDDGFTLNWSVANATAYVVHYYALSDKLVTSATINTFSLTTGTGNLSVTSAGFQPSFVMFLSGATTTHGVNTAELTYTTGVAASATSEWTVSGRSDSAVDFQDECSVQRTDASIALIGTTNNCATATQDAYADFTQFTANGFDINKSNAPAGAFDVFYLALAGPSFTTGSFNQPTATGNQSITGVGFQPSGVFFGSRDLVSSTTVDAHASFSFGAASALGSGVTGEGAVSQTGPDNIDNASPDMRQSTTKAISQLQGSNDTATVSGEADLASFDSDGFTLNWTTADATADQMVYWAIGAGGRFPKLTQEGYVFENDDEDQVTADSFDENSVQAGGAFSVSGDRVLNDVKKGERLVARTHLKNTGTDATNQNLAMFYDRGDGIWTKVKGVSDAVTAAGNCTDTNFDCTTVDNTGTDRGQYSSLAYDNNGMPWVSYYDVTAQALVVAQYVGSGGTGCTSTAWSCTAVDDDASNQGQYTSIAFDSTGKAWVSYYDVTATSLMVAQYVGTGGTGCGGTPAAWTCETVDNTGTNTGQYTSIAIDASDEPWVSYYDVTNTSLRIASRGGIFGAACTDADWNCGVVDQDTDNTGQYSALAFAPNGLPWISYYDATNSQLMVGQYVASGGTGCGATGSTAWSCEAVDNTGTNTGQYTSIAFDPSGLPWVGYYDVTNTALLVAHRDTTGFGSSCTDTDWRCGTVDNTGTVGEWASLGFDSGGNAWVSYFNNDATATNRALVVARYDGDATASNCSDSAWTCTTVDTTGLDAVGEYSSLAFSPNGNASIAYYDGGSETALKFASINRRGEIVTSASLASANTESLTESHADMTSSTDTTERNDSGANLCISGSTTWNNGVASENEEVRLSLVAGNVTAQCSEVAFSIDTSQAIAGQTYRFIIASEDGWRNDKGSWRGPISVASNSYPTLTVENDSTSNVRYSKDSVPKFTDCTDSSWGCTAVDDDANNQGQYTAIAIDQSGKKWVSYYDVTGTQLMVAEYVGSGGTGCGGSPSAWTCTIVDNTGTDRGQYTSIAIDTSGTPWISYYDVTGTQLMVARYVGTNGSGCTATSWSCEAVDDSGTSTGQYTSIAIDKQGQPWVSYYDTTNTALRVATRSKAFGQTCTNTNWTCGAVDQDTDDTGQYTSIAIDDANTAWVSYYDNTAKRLMSAHYVGFAGTNCGATGSTAWNCEIVDDVGATNGVGRYTSIAINHDGNPWISYQDVDNADLKVVNRVASGGSGCTGATNSTLWSCVSVDTTTTLGLWTSIAFDSSGNAWVAYYNDDATATNKALKLARYDGDATSSGCNVAAWTCTTIDSNGTDAIGEYANLAFDGSGAGWLSYYDGGTEVSLKISKLHLTSTQPGNTNPPSVMSRSARSGDGLYRLDSGKAPYSESGTCSATADNQGYCGSATDDTSYDNMASIANERPVFSMATDHSNNTDIPTATWIGRSDVNAATRNIKLQVYRFGTVNAWVDITTDSSCAANTDCNLSGSPSTSFSDYYESIGGDDVIYFRVWQSEHGSAMNLKMDSFSVDFAPPAPNSPTSLAQTKTDTTSISTGGWTNESSVRFTVSASDPDSSDSLQLCIEKDTLATSFSNSEDSCGSAVAYSGTPVTLEHTISGHVNGDEYHWQARVKDAAGNYSAWISFGGNAESARDYGIDTTAPTSGVVYDGTTVAVDVEFNDGSLSTLAANWDSFDSSTSGLNKYEYSIGTTPGGTNVKGWTDNSTSTSFSDSSLTLSTSQTYYTNVRATDNAGNVSSVFSSDGQVVLPSLSFSVSPASVSFSNLNTGNSYTDSQTTTITTSTNANNGYVVKSQLVDPLVTSGLQSLAVFNGGSYASPDSWQGGDTGFGYTSSDTLVQGSNKFQNNPCPGGSSIAVPGCFAPFSTSTPGDIVADNTTSTTNQSFTITYRATVSATQAAGNYSGRVIYIVTPNY